METTCTTFSQTFKLFYQQYLFEIASDKSVFLRNLKMIRRDDVFSASFSTITRQWKPVARLEAQANKFPRNSASNEVQLERKYRLRFLKNENNPF